MIRYIVIILSKYCSRINCTNSYQCFI